MLAPNFPVSSQNKFSQLVSPFMKFWKTLPASYMIDIFLGRLDSWYAQKTKVSQFTDKYIHWIDQYMLIY